jgi:hypothetical protein
MSRPTIGFGAAYYTEYRHNPDIGRDLDLMAAAGFSVIRVGESVWSTWEPEDGRFDLDWLQLVLDAAHERGIGLPVLRRARDPQGRRPLPGPPRPSSATRSTTSRACGCSTTTTSSSGSSTGCAPGTAPSSG